MHLLYLLTQSLDSPSGLGRYYPLAKELVRRGHQVDVVALHPDIRSLPQRQYVDHGIRVSYVAPMHVQKHGSEKTYYPPARLFGIVLQACWKETLAALTSDADLVHVFKPHPMNGLAGLAAKYLRGKPLLLDYDDYEAGSNRFGGAWQKKIVAAFEDGIPPRVDAVTTHSRALRERLVQRGIPGGRIFMISNGVDAARFAPPAPGQVSALRSRLGLQGKQVVTFMGTLGLSNHPVDLLIAAFREVRDRLPGAVLLIVGGGEDFHLLQQQAAGLGPAVIFTGRVQPEQAPLYLAVSDVSVDPVHDDLVARARSPLKLFESWAMGVPFVSAAVGDRPALLGDPPAGCLARPGDPHSLAQSILQVLTDPAKAAELRRLGPERVQPYLWENLAGQVESVYLQALDRRRLPG